MKIAKHIRQATLAAVLGAWLTGEACAAQRSLAEIISESFEQSASQGPGTDAPAAQPTEKTAPTVLPLPFRTQPAPAAPTASPTTRIEANVAAAVESLDESLDRAIDRFHGIVIAPERLTPIPAADPTMSCNDLYVETSRLVALGERYRPSYAEDPRNIAIGAAGFVFTPAFYLYGVTAYAAWYEDGNRKDAKQRITELRRLMANRRCFARD